MECFEIQKNEKILWFYPAKVQNSFHINSISLEGANLERVANDSNFPDPFYYFIGFYSHSSLEDNKRNEKKPSTKLKSLSFVEYFKETRNSSFSPISTRSSKKFHRNNLFMENEEERSEIYRAIKEPQFFFDENQKLIREMNMTIMQNKNQIKIKRNQKKSSEHLSKSVLFIREFHERSQQKKKEHRSPLERKFYRTFQKGFKDPLEPKPEIYLNQLSVSSIVSHRWRNEASKQRILKMTPQFSDEKYNFSNFTSNFRFFDVIKNRSSLQQTAKEGEISKRKNERK